MDSTALGINEWAYTLDGQSFTMDSRLWTILPALLAGVLIGAILMQFALPPIAGTSVPSHTLSTATGCADADDPRG